MKLPNKHRFRFLIILILLVFPLYTAYSILHTDHDVSAQCLESSLNEGLISAGGDVIGNTGNIEQVCVTGTDASYREFKVPSYQDLEDQFYTLSRVPANIKKGAPPANLSFSGNGIYLQNGDFTINTSSGTGAQIIFVRGSLHITGNINYADPITDPNNAASGLVFIVRDNINIHSNVTKVNAVLISSGIICTYFSGSCPTNNSAYTEQLIINGSLISLNKETLASSAIKLRRNLVVNDQPAEKINKQPKYLYILRNGLFTKDLVVTVEDQQYDIPEIDDITPPPPQPPPQPVTCIQATNPLGADDLKIPGCIGIP